ncbi:MAG: alkaline phosphatase family protein [Acidobacteriota bacterium]
MRLVTPNMRKVSRCLLLLALAHVGLSAGCGPVALPGKPSGVRVLVIGLDGADWDRIQPMIDQQRLPHIAGLLSRGARGQIRLERPPLSPLLWTTLATSQHPDVHGILDFVEVERGTSARVPVTGRSRRVKALWNFADDGGLTSAVLGWWATWPAERIRGVMVSDRWSYTLARLDDGVPATSMVFPPEFAGDLAALRVTPESLGETDLRRFLPIDAAARRALAADAGATHPGDGDPHPVLTLRRIVAATSSLDRAAVHLLKTRQPDLTMVYFEGIDEVGHHFARFENPAMPGVSVRDRRLYGGVVDAFYRFQDEVVGRLLAAAGPDTAVILVSDHGFARGAERPVREPAGLSGRAALWHVGPGVLILAGAPFTSTPLAEVRLVDIAPTILVALGLPVAENLAGRPLLSAIDRRFLDAHPVASIASYESVGRPVARVEAPASAVGPDAAAAITRLRGLGYIDTPSGSPGKTTLTPAARLHLAVVLDQEGRTWEARDAYRVAIAARPHDTVALRSLFDLLVKMKKTDEALDAARDLLMNGQPLSDDSYLTVARFWAGAERIDAGRGVLADLPDRPASAGPAIARAVLAQAAGDEDLAEKEARGALEADPGSWEAAEVLFHLLETAGRLDEAIPTLREGLAERGGNSVPHLLALGYISLQEDNLDAAEDYLTRALEEAPGSSEVLVYLGDLHLRRGRHDEAARDFGTVLAAEPDRLDVRASHILALGRAGRIAAALESFRQAGAPGRRTPAVLNAAAYACLINGLPDQGLPLAQQSLQVAPGRADTRDLLTALQEDIHARGD